MMERNRRNAIFLFLMLFGLFAGGQTANRSDWPVAFEKIILDTDREIYFAGEELLFTASYFIDQGRISPPLSQILYVELIDYQHKNPTLRKKFRITDFEVSNRLILPGDMPSGNYLLRAYTLYQQNLSPSLYGNRFITVLNPESTTPEGEILFRTARDSCFGSNGFHPSPNLHTEALLPDGGNDISLVLTSQSPWPAPSRVRVSHYTSDFRLVDDTLVSLTREKAEIRFPLQAPVTTGIHYLVVSSPAGKRLALEALFQPMPLRKMEVVTAGNRFHPGQQIQGTFRAAEGPLPEKVQVSAVLQGATLSGQPGIPETYLRHPWLVEAWFMSKPWLAPSEIKQILTRHTHCLDTLLFSGQKAPSPLSPPEYLPETRDVSISGIMRDKESGAPLSGKDVFVSVLYNHPQLHISRTNSRGEFIVPLNRLTGLNDIFITPEFTGEKASSQEILIKMPFSGDIPPLGEQPLVLYHDQREIVETMYSNFQIEQKFRGRSEEEADKRERGSDFNIDGAKTIIKSEDYIRLDHLREMFGELVNNVLIRREGGRHILKVLDRDGRPLPGHPLVLLDHLPVFDIDTLLEIPIAQIEKIEVINTTYILGLHSINGIVMLTTKSSNFGGMKFNEPSTFLQFQAPEPPFTPAPSAKTTGHETPDFRTTLFWNPHIFTEGQEGSFDFQASDRKGVYTVVVKGYASDGTCYYGRKEIVIE